MDFIGAVLSGIAHFLDTVAWLGAILVIAAVLAILILPYGRRG